MVKKVPKRMCIACREMFEKRELTRIVRTPDEEVVYDPTGKKAGKGAYICKAPGCFAKAKKSRLLEKHLKCSLNADIYEQLEDVLHNES